MKYNMEELAEQHGGLVKSIAIRLSRVYNEEVEDLIQIGYIGLIKAAERFDESRGLAFSTYAVPMITGEIRSQLRDHGAIKVSRSLKSDAYAVRRAESAFITRCGRSPKLTELAEEAGLTVSGVSLEQKGDLLLLCAALLYEGETLEVSVRIGGE